MNVRSPRKTATNYQNTNQDNIYALPKLPPSTINLIPKEHVGVRQNKQLQFDQTNERIFSPIRDRSYFNISIDQDDFISSIWRSNINEDLFDDLTSEDNTVSQSDTIQKPVDELPAVTSPEVPNKTNEKNNNLNLLYSIIRIIPTEDHVNTILRDAIRNHPLTPIIEDWVSQKKGSQDMRYGCKSKMNKFIVFLIDLGIKYPTESHLLLYKHALKNSNVKYASNYISTTIAFFKWAGDHGYYKDISEKIYYQLSNRRRSYIYNKC